MYIYSGVNDMKKIFIAGPPVKEEELFFNRKKEVDTLLKGTGNNFAIVAIRRVGKTSLIYHIEKEYRKRKIIPIFINVSEIAPLTIENFLKQYSIAVTKAYSEATNDPGLLERFTEFMKGNWKGLLEYVKGVHFGVKDILEVWFESQQIPAPRKKDYTSLIQKTVNYPEKLARALNRNFVVIFDEFQQLHTLGDEFLWALRGNMQKTKKTSYIISGSAVATINQLLGDKRSPFYGLFLSLRLEGIDDASAKKLLDRSKKFGFEISDEVKTKVIDVTKGYPLYLQGFGLAAYLYATSNKIKTIKEKDLEACWKRMFELLHFHFCELEKELPGKKRDIMLTIARKGLHRTTEISKELNEKVSTVGVYLHRLLNEGFLEKKKGKYHIKDTVFEEWLRLK